MKIIEIKENKKKYLSLLLLTDEQEDMIDRYLEKGVMYVLDDNGIKCECVVTDEEKCGFVRSHSLPNFFIDNYDHPIYECGVQLIDMIYLRRPLEWRD